MYNHIKREIHEKATWATQGGIFKTFAEMYLGKLQLSQFTIRNNLEGNFRLFEKYKANRYNIIIGRNLQQKIDLKIFNSKQAFTWMGIIVLMNKIGHWNRKLVTSFWEKNKINKKNFKHSRNTGCGIWNTWPKWSSEQTNTSNFILKNQPIRCIKAKVQNLQSRTWPLEQPPQSILNWKYGPPHKKMPLTLYHRHTKIPP